MIFKYPNSYGTVCECIQQCGSINSSKIKLKGICDDESIVWLIQIYPRIWASYLLFFFLRFNEKSIRNEICIIRAFSLNNLNFSLFGIILFRFAVEWNNHCDALILSRATSKKALYLTFKFYWSANIPMPQNNQCSPQKLEWFENYVIC